MKTISALYSPATPAVIAESVWYGSTVCGRPCDRAAVEAAASYSVEAYSVEAGHRTVYHGALDGERWTVAIGD